MATNAESHRYHTEQVGSKLWYIYDGHRIMGEAFTEVDAEVIVRALRLSETVRASL